MKISYGWIERRIFSEAVRRVFAVRSSFCAVAAVHGFGVLARVDSVRDAEFDFVRIGDRVDVIEANDPVEIIDAFDIAIGEKRLDDVAKTKRVVFAVIVFRQCDGSKVEFEFAVFANHVAPDDPAHVVE